LIKMNTVLVPHRSFVVYLGMKNIEEKIRIPIFGNKFILKAEDRSLPRNQYYLLKEAGILLPKIYSSPSEIDGPAIVKIQDAKRQLERAFFIVTSPDDYKRKSETRVNTGLIDKHELDHKSTIEQFLIGTYFNFNYFYSPLTGKVDFLGIERRLQSNINDYTTSVPAVNQLDINIDLQNIEVGHTPASIRESLLDKVFKMGDKFAMTCLKEYPPGIIGPYSLQCVVTVDLDIVVYDVSLRVPGNPILATTSPYTKYQYGQTFGVGRRIAMELKSALDEKGRFSSLFT
jgi:5-formaminoimidazole-4-carboxamide-1-(beta)-D-ribofuranosyl 5'-monophosphate synthetase